MTYRPTQFDQLPDDGILQQADDMEPYVFDETIAIAVDVALATKRPLLVSGNPGCGKSRLADAIAAVQGWNLLTRTVTSRTRLESLTAEVDQLRRLNDAQTRDPNHAAKPDNCYLNPGLFWWAFDPDSAQTRGLSPREAAAHNARLPYPGVERGQGGPHPTVLLIDEIDKAEPDLPNDLLEPLDRRRFDLPDGFRVGDEPRIDARARPEQDQESTLLTVITTNGERDLPPAFLRRCVMLDLPDPDRDKLIAIGRHHFPPDQSQAKADRIDAIADLIVRFREPAGNARLRPPGTAEFLDAIRACDQLGIDIDPAEGSVWRRLERAVVDKEGRLRTALDQHPGQG